MASWRILHEVKTKAEADFVPTKHSLKLVSLQLFRHIVLSQYCVNNASDQQEPMGKGWLLVTQPRARLAVSPGDTDIPATSDGRSAVIDDRPVGSTGPFGH